MKPRVFILLSGQMISQIGTGITLFSLPWIVLLKTGSAAQMGWLYAAGYVPYLAITLFGGWLADRFNRKYILLIVDFLRALVLAALPLGYALHQLNMVWLYAVQLLVSALSAFFDGSFYPYVPSIVPADQLHRTNGLLQFGESLGTLFGPAIAGLLISFIGIQYTLCFDTVTYIISVVSIIPMLNPGRPEVKTSRALVWKELGDGIRFVWQNPSVRFLALMGSIGNLAESAIAALLLFRLRHELGMSAHGAGMVITGVGIGGVIGSIISSWMGNHFRVGHVIMLCLGAVVVAPFVLALAANPVVIFMAVALTGAAGVVLNVQKMSVYQTVIPNALMGKSMATTRIMSWISLPVGSALGGNVAQRVGAPLVFGVSGALHLSMLFYGLVSNKKEISMPPSQASEMR